MNAFSTFAILTLFVAASLHAEEPSVLRHFDWMRGYGIDGPPISI